MTLARGLLAIVAAICVYAAGVFVWMFGRYLAVFPGPSGPYDLRGLLLPPVVPVLVAFAWMIVRGRGRRNTRRERRFLHFGAAAFVAVIVSGVQILWPGPGTHNTLPAYSAAALMLAVAIFTGVADRDPDTALLLALITLFAIVPVVIMGRKLAIGFAMAWEAVV